MVEFRGTMTNQEIKLVSKAFHGLTFVLCSIIGITMVDKRAYEIRILISE